MDSRDPAVQTEDKGDHAAIMTETRLAALLIDAVDEYAIFMLDPAGRVVTWNTGAHRIKGYDTDEIIGRHFSVFYTPGDVRAAKPDRVLRDATERGHAHDEGWRVRRDGSRFWACVSVTAIHDAAGRIEGFAKVTRDDTDRRRMEEQVRQLELLDDRERIAKAMHDTVVHRIFEASMIMENALGLIDNGHAAQQVTTAVGVLDATLKEIRAVVLALDGSDPPGD